MIMTTNEVDLDNQPIDNEMEAVMKQRVAKPTRRSYEIRNITCILWLFGHITNITVFYNLQSMT